MNQRRAFQQTLTLALERGMDLHDTGMTGFSYLLDMWLEIEANPEFDEFKLGRWLGWAQASVVASGVATLEDMKEINKANA